METKIYVDNLSNSTTEEDLRKLFIQAGTVISVALIKDRDTGQSKGFAFVEMSDQSEAENAIRILNGYSLANRPLKVNLARPREESNFGFSRDRYGGEGYSHRDDGYGKSIPNPELPGDPTTDAPPPTDKKK